MKDENNNVVFRDRPMSFAIDEGDPIVFLGGESVSVSNIIIKKGNYEYIEKNINKCGFILRSQLPFFLPLREHEIYPYTLDGRKFEVIYSIRDKDQVLISHPDHQVKDRFGCLSIMGHAFYKLISNEPTDLYAFKLISGFIQSVNEYYGTTFSLDWTSNCQIKIGDIRGIQRSQLREFWDNSNLQADYFIPFNGTIKFGGKSYLADPGNEELLAKLTRDSIVEEIINDKASIEAESFTESLFLLLHNYAYYVRQKPEAFFDQKEENIRDIFITMVQSLFIYAEAEAFNYDGKADFKVVNPNNRYEYVIGEFKIWSGVDSFEELFKQATGKHITGQEKEIYMIMINRNMGSIWDSFRELLMRKSEINTETLKRITPDGSIEEFYIVDATINEQLIPVRVGVINTHYKRV